jgi:hypothetical protein
VHDRNTERPSFAEVSQLHLRAPGIFDGEVSASWTIGGKPNGGYLLSMLGRAGAAVSPHEHVVAASAHFLHSPDPGPVVVEAELLRGGRSASQVRASMRQDDQICVESLFTTSRLRADDAPYWDKGVPPLGRVPFEECVRLQPVSPEGVAVSIMDQVEVRFEPESARCLAGSPTGRGELRGWLTLPRGEGFDPTSLLYAVDGVPPATFDIELAGWVPTLELTAYVRALPAPGPVRFLVRAQLIEARRVDEVCFIWDSRDRLVAQGTQLAGIRLG